MSKRVHQKKGKANKKKAVNPRLPAWTKWAIFLFGFLLYANTIPHDFTQDDAIVITDNQYTQQGIAGIPGLLSKDTFFGFFKVEGKSKIVSGGRYRPLTPVLFALEYQLAGNAPWLGHFINALLYGVTGLVLFQFLILFAGKIGFPAAAPWLAALTAALYIAHPVHTEAVANIKGRDEMLAFLLSVISLWTASRFKDSGKLRDAVFSGIAMFLALLSKENAITFFLVIPLALYLTGKTRLKGVFSATLPAIAAIAAFLALRTSILGFDFGGTPMELLNNPFLKIEQNQYVPFSFGEKSATILYTLGKYIQLFLFPYPLTHDYYPRHVGIMNWSDWQVWLSFMLYAALTAMAIYLFLKKKNSPSGKLVLFGIAYYLITLSIVSNVVFPIGTNMSERFLYMPSLGLCLIAGWALWQLKNRVSMRAMMVTGGLIIAVFSVLTISRNAVWKDNYTLFLTDIRTSSRSAKLLNSVGGELITRGTQTEDESDRNTLFAEAQPYLRKALEIHPNYKLAYLLLGNSHFYLGQYDDAIAIYRQTLNLDPGYEDGRKNLGIALRDGGKARGEQQNDPRGALPLLLEAEKYLPEDSETMRLLGVCYGRLGQTQNAIRYFEKELSLASTNASTYFNLGIAHQNAGNLEKAKEYFEKARELDPEILNKNR